MGLVLDCLGGGGASVTHGSLQRGLLIKRPLPSAEQLQVIIPNTETFLIVCIPVGQWKFVSYPHAVYSLCMKENN